MRKGITLLLLLGVMVCTAKVYKQVDQNGQITFTDRPSKQATPIKIKEPQTYQSPSRFQPSANETISKANQKALGPTSITITTPENQTTIRNNNGDVMIKWEVKPLLKTDKQGVFLYLDSKMINPKDKPMTGSSAKLTNVDRGTHTVQVKVVNKNSPGGVAVAESQVITFYLHRHVIKKAPAPVAPSK